MSLMFHPILSERMERDPRVVDHVAAAQDEDAFAAQVFQFLSELVVRGGGACRSPS